LERDHDELTHNVLVLFTTTHLGEDTQRRSSESIVSTMKASAASRIAFSGQIKSNNVSVMTSVGFIVWRSGVPILIQIFELPPLPEATWKKNNKHTCD
jgi:hypothetical protein